MSENLQISVAIEGKDSLSPEVLRAIGTLARLQQQTPQTTRELERLTSGTRLAEQAFSGLSRGLLSSTVAGGLLIGGGLGIAGGVAALTRETIRFGESSVRSFADTQRAVTEVNTLFGLSGRAARESFGQIDQQVRDLAVTFGTGGRDAARAFYQGISAGVPREGLAAFENVAGRTALGGNVQATQATDVLASTLRQFNLPFSDAERVADRLFVTVARGRTTIGELSQSLFQLGPSAAAAGLSLDETLAAVATLTASGVPTAEAMTRLRAAVDALSHPSAEATRTLDLYGVSVTQASLKSEGLAGTLQRINAAVGGNAAAMQTIFGSTEAYQAAVALASQHSAEFADNLTAVSQASGTMANAAEQMGATTAHQFDIMGAKFEEFRRRVGEGVAGPLSDVITVVDQIGVRFGAWPATPPPAEQVERFQRLAAAANVLAAALAGLSGGPAGSVGGMFTGLAAPIAASATAQMQAAAAANEMSREEYTLNVALTQGKITIDQFDQGLAALMQRQQEAAGSAGDFSAAIERTAAHRREERADEDASRAATAIDKARIATEQWDAAAQRFAQRFSLQDTARGQQATADEARGRVEAAQRQISALRDTLEPLRAQLQQTMEAPIEGATRLQAALAGVNQQISRSDLVVAQVRLEQIRARIAGEAPPPIDREALMQAAMDRALAGAQGDVLRAQQGVSITPYETLRQLATAPPELPGPVAVARAGQLSGQVRAGEATITAQQPQLLVLQRAADAAAMQARNAQRIAQAYQEAYDRQTQLTGAIGQRPGSTRTPEQAGEQAAEAMRAQIAGRSAGAASTPPPGAGPQFTLNAGGLAVYVTAAPTKEAIKAAARAEVGAALDQLIDEALAANPVTAAPTVTGQRR